MRRLIAALALIASPALADDITVFAAASMKTALDEIAARHEAATGDRVTLSYAGSNALAMQIRAGAPADIYISAAPRWMAAVADAGAVAEQVDLVGNTLVLIAHAPGAGDGAPALRDLPVLLAGGHLAMAMVDAVPAGIYGKQALTRLGLWDQVAADVAQADNVRAALRLVALGEAPYGVVYASDAAVEPGVHVVGRFPPDSHDPIVYPAALLNGAGPGARAFFDTLQGAGAAATFAANGFTVGQ